MAQGGRSVAGLNEVLPAAVWLQGWFGLGFFSSSGAAGFRCVFDGSQEEPTDDSPAQPWGCEIRVFFGGGDLWDGGMQGQHCHGDGGVCPCHSFLTLSTILFPFYTTQRQRGQRGAGPQGGHPAALGEWDPHRTQGLDPLLFHGFP